MVVAIVINFGVSTLFLEVTIKKHTSKTSAATSREYYCTPSDLRVVGRALLFSLLPSLLTSWLPLLGSGISKIQVQAGSHVSAYTYLFYLFNLLQQVEMLVTSTDFQGA